MEGTLKILQYVNKVQNKDNKSKQIIYGTSHSFDTEFKECCVSLEDDLKNISFIFISFINISVI